MVFKSDRQRKFVMARLARPTPEFTRIRITKKTTKEDVQRFFNNNKELVERAFKNRNEVIRNVKKSKEFKKLGPLEKEKVNRKLKMLAFAKSPRKFFDILVVSSAALAGGGALVKGSVDIFAKTRNPASLIGLLLGLGLLAITLRATKPLFRASR